MRKQFCLILTSLTLFAAVFIAGATEIDETGCVIGRWTADIKAAREYARTHQTFFIINFGQTAGCAFCNQAEASIYGSDLFHQWLVDNRVPSVYCDYNRGENDSLVKEVMRLYPGAAGFPSLIIVDERDNGAKGYGTRQIGLFQTISGEVNNGIFFDPFVTTNFIRTVESYLNYDDNVIGTGTPTLTATAQPQRYGLYHSYGTNSLDAVRARSPVSHPQYQYSDSNDWYSVTNIVKDRRYTIKAVDVSDPDDVGRVEFYTSKKTVQSNQVAYAMSLRALAAMPQGFSYVAKESGTNYIRFTRTSYRISETVKYAFEYSASDAADDPTVTFLTSTAEAPDTTNAVKITVCRADQTDGAVTVGYRTADMNASNGVDYVAAGSTGTVVFAVGETNTTISISLIPDKGHIWTGDRFFRIQLTSGDGYVLGEGTNVTVTLKESDPEKDDFDRENEATLTNAFGLAVASGVTTNLLATLNGRDASDVFVFTNLVHSMRYRYAFSEVTNINGGSVRAALYTNLTTEAEGLTNAWLPAMEVTNGAWQIFSPVTTNVVYLKVWREGASQPACVKYALTYGEWPRAVIGFARDSRSVSATNGQRSVTLQVVRDGQTNEVSAVRLQTVDGAAEEGKDFTPVVTNLTFEVGETTKDVTVDLLYNRDSLALARTFYVKVEPLTGDDGVVTSSWATATVTLAPDPSGDKYDVGDDTWSNAVPIAVKGGGEVVSSGPRYLNGTDTNDWFCLTGIETGKAYRIRLKDVTAKGAEPAAAFYYSNLVAVVNETNITWRALTNAFWYRQGESLVFGEEATNGVWLCLSRPPENTNGYFSYTLEIKEWFRPRIGFETNILEQREAAGQIEVNVTRSNNLSVAQKVTYLISPETAQYGIDYTAAATNDVLRFGEGEMDAQSIPFDLKEDKVWRRDRSFTISLAVDNETDPVYANLTVRIIDKDEQYDERDGENGTDDADATNATMLAMQRTEQDHKATLNGADTADWFVFTNLEAHVRYYVSVTNLVETNAAAQAWFYAGLASAEAGTAWTNVSLETLAQGRVDFTPEASGDVYLKLTQEKSGGTEVDASVAYSLRYAAWPRPVISLGADTLDVVSPGAEAIVTIWRTNNTDDVMYVNVQTEDVPGGNALAGTDYTSVSQPVPFASGVSSNVVPISVVPDMDSVWTGDRMFRVTISPDAGADVETVITSQLITLREKEAQFDARDGADGTADATASTATRLGVYTQTHTLAGTLNGSDQSDWFAFTNLQADVLYRISVSNLIDSGAVNLMATFYTNAVTAQTGADAWTNMPLSELTNAFIFRAATEDDMYLAVRRDAGQAGVQYTLAFRELVPCSVGFVTDAVTVSEAAHEVLVQVACTAENDLVSDARVILKTRNGTATANDDYVALTKELVWPAGTPSGTYTQKVCIALRNYDGLWEGNETFAVTLAPGSETAQVQEPATVTVTLVEKDAPVVGRFTVVGYGNGTNALTATSRIAAREGESVTFWLSRSGGRDGDLNAVLTWQDGTIKTVVTNEAFKSLEDGIRPLTVTVPVRDGYQAQRPMTLAFSQVGSKLSNGTASLTVLDAAYVQALPAYSSDDRTRVPFVSSAGAWFVTGDGGSLRCVPPAIGKTSVMQATVTGPGLLRFFADTSDAAGCEFTVTVSGGADQNVASGMTNEIAVASGTRTILWKFFRPLAASAGTNACATISGIEWIPDLAREALGTFNGHVWRDNEAGSDDDDFGLAAMTVAQNGRISGTFRFARDSYTFTSSGYSITNDGVYMASLSARSGLQTVPLTLTVSNETGVAVIEDEMHSMRANLSRNGWNDKPLSQMRDAVMKGYEGYYTLVLPDAETEDGDVFGSGYLALTVAKNGSIKAAGKLADGTSVSLSSVLMLDAMCQPYTIFFVAPYAYQGGYLAMSVYFSKNEAGVTVVDQGEEFGPVWINNHPRATGEGVGFQRHLSVVGGYYDRTESLKAYYEGQTLTVGELDQAPELSYWTWNGSTTGLQTTSAVVWATSASVIDLRLNDAGSGFDVLSGTAGTPALFSINVNRATGLFSGYVRARYEYVPSVGRVATTMRSFPYQGALVPSRPDPSDGITGRGCFLTPQRSTTDPVYVFNRSYDLVIEDTDVIR